MVSEDQNENENIRVAVRCRPMNEREIQCQANTCFTLDQGTAVLTNPENATEQHRFAYDFVYEMDEKQHTVYQDIGQPILARAFEGYNGTIFAYGQTGSGKSFSMTGVLGSGELEGLIPRMNKGIFDRIELDKVQAPDVLYLVECSFFEIYNEIIYDLLNPSKDPKQMKRGLEIKEHAALGIYVKGLQERVVEQHDQVLELMKLGQQSRTVGSTLMNAESSRSHSIFIIKIHQKNATDETKNLFAKINLVDLAGSERASSTGASGSRLKEGANINKSLSALGNVINALVEVSRTEKKQFIPYRNSKLTRVLQESLGGNSLCSMLATLSPATINFSETLSTLKYASRAKSIKVKARKNEESSQISKLNDEIEALKRKLQEQTTTGTVDPQEKILLVSKYEKQIQEMDEIRKQTWEDKVKLSRRHEMERKKMARDKALAEQKIQEEKKKKWTMLEQNGDMELAIRACVELTSPSPPWIDRVLKMKTLERQVVENRTLIAVFKTSLDKDVDTWQNGSPDLATQHLLSRQCVSKLQNIQQESLNVLKLEQEVLSMNQELIIGLQNAISALHIESSESTSLSRQQKRVYDEQNQALTITLRMLTLKKDDYLKSAQQERKRLFRMTVLADQLRTELSGETIVESISTSEASLELEVVDNSLEQFDDAVLDLPDSCFSASSNTCHASKARILGSEAWYPSTGDTSPYLQITLPTPHYISEIQIQGTDAIRTDDDTSQVLSHSKSSQVLEMYQDMSIVTGDMEQTYSIVGNVISWESLLKTSKLPRKLLTRPPVRFLHDVISQVILNTGYAADLYSDAEMDYNQVQSKTDRVEYLTKIISKVNECLAQDDQLQVKATDVTAGKQVELTLQFLSHLGLTALKYWTENATKESDEKETIQAAWTRQCMIKLSADGRDWHTTDEPLPACTDSSTIVSMKLSDQLLKVPALFVRILPVAFERAAALRVSVKGSILADHDVHMKGMGRQAKAYEDFFSHLLTAADMLFRRTKESFEQHKESQENTQEVCKALENELASMKKQNSNLLGELSEANAKLRENEKRIEQDQCQQETLSKILEERREAEKTLKLNLSTESEKVVSLSQQIEELAAKCQGLESKYESSLQSQADLDSICTKLREQTKSEANSSQEVNAEVMTLRVEIDQLKRSILQTESEKEVVVEAKKAIEKAFEKERSHSAETVAASERNERHVVELEQMMEQLRVQLKNENETREVLLKQIEELKAIREAEKVQLKLMEDRLDRVDDQTSHLRLEAEKDRLEKTCKALELDLETIRHELSDANRTIEDLEQQRDTFDEMEDEWQNQIHVLTEERDTSRQKEEQLFAENTEKDEELERMRDGYGKRKSRWIENVFV